MRYTPIVEALCNTADRGRATKLSTVMRRPIMPITPAQLLSIAASQVKVVGVGAVVDVVEVDFFVAENLLEVAWPFHAGIEAIFWACAVELHAAGVGITVREKDVFVRAAGAAATASAVGGAFEVVADPEVGCCYGDGSWGEEEDGLERQHCDEMDVRVRVVLGSEGRSW